MGEGHGRPQGPSCPWPGQVLLPLWKAEPRTVSPSQSHRSHQGQGTDERAGRGRAGYTPAETPSSVQSTFGPCLPGYPGNPGTPSFPWGREKKHDRGGTGWRGANRPGQEAAPKDTVTTESPAVLWGGTSKHPWDTTVPRPCADGRAEARGRGWPCTSRVLRGRHVLPLRLVLSLPRPGEARWEVQTLVRPVLLIRGDEVGQGGPSRGWTGQAEKRPPIKGCAFLPWQGRADTLSGRRELGDRNAPSAGGVQSPSSRGLGKPLLRGAEGSEGWTQDSTWPSVTVHTAAQAPRGQGPAEGPLEPQRRSVPPRPPSTSATDLLPSGPQRTGVTVGTATTLRAFRAIFSPGARRADLPLQSEQRT